MVLRVWVLLFGLVLIHFNLAAQNYDSLLKEVLAAPKDSTRVLLLNEASLAVRDTNVSLALQYAEEARQLAERLKYRRGLGIVSVNLGWIYFRKSDYLNAYTTTTEALKINREFDNRKEIANCYINLGLLDFRQKNHQQALSNYKLAYQGAKELNDSKGKNRSLYNLSTCFFALHHLDSARHFALLSLNENVNNPIRQLLSKRILGDICLDEGNYTEALKYFEDCLAIATSQHNNPLKSSSRYRIGKAYLKLNNPDKALLYLNQNIQLAKVNKEESRLRSTYQVLSQAYASKGDFVKAYEYQSLFYQLNDSVTDQRAVQQILMLQAKHDSDLKNTKIELLTKDSLLKESEIRNQRLLIYFGFGTLVILSSLLLIILRGFRKSKSAHNLINRQANDLMKLNATKDKIFSIIGHDLRSPLAGLSGLMNLISQNALTQQEFLEVSKPLKSNLEYVHSDLDNLLQWANNQIKGIKPFFTNTLLHSVVIEKINLLGEVAKAKGISVEYQVPETIQVFTDLNHLGLIVRNLLSNAIKFSNPGGIVKIAAIQDHEIVRLTVSDTGVGMSAQEVEKLFKIDSHFTKPGTQKEKGFGLGLMLVKEFVEINNGMISVTSQPGQGSSFTVSLKGDSTSTN